QAENLRIYAIGYAQWKDPKYLIAAQEIHRFLMTFLLSPDGAFYTSQDADVVQGKHSAEYFQLDDAQRRKRGIPRIDKHMYARENGWAIRARAALYGAAGDPKYLDEATRAANWAQKNRALPNGGFKHGEHDPAGPYMGDSLAMGQAFLELYAVTGDRQWLASAESATKYTATKFKGVVGYNTSAQGTDPSYHPKPQRDENVSMAILANYLYHYTGESVYRDMSLQAMRFVAATRDDHPAAGTLLADYELTTDPTHITVVGH